MAVYSNLNSEAKKVVDAVFTGTSVKEIEAMNLPEPMKLNRSLSILYPGDKDIRERISGDYRVTVAVRKMKTGGMNSIQIEKQIGQPSRLIRNWVRGRPTGDFREWNRSGFYEIPATESVDFARFLGFVLGRRGKYKMTSGFVVESKNERLLSEFEDAVMKLWGVECTKSKAQSKKETGIKQKGFYSHKIRNYLEILTNGWTTLPWGHLVTEQERKAFLRAWLSSSSDILLPGGSHKAILQVMKSSVDEKEPSLLQDLRILFFKLGFGSTLAKQGGRVYSVRVLDLDDLQRLADEKSPDGTVGYFIQDGKRKRLLDALEKSHATEGKHHTRHDYYLFLKSVSDGMSVDDAAEKFGLYPYTALRWFNGTLKPTAVNWDDEVRELEKKRKPDEIGYAFRNITHEPGEARRLALKNDMKQLEEIKARKDIEKFLSDTGLPLLPGEYWPLSRGTLREAEVFIKSKTPELVQRMGEISDRLVEADEQAVLKVIRQLPDREIYERSLLKERSKEAAPPFTTVSLDRIVLAIARQPLLVNEILNAPTPER